MENTEDTVQGELNELEIKKALCLIDYMHGIFGKVDRRNPDGGITLSENEAETFSWMLCDSGIALAGALKAVA